MIDKNAADREGRGSTFHLNIAATGLSQSANGGHRQADEYLAWGFGLANFRWRRAMRLAIGVFMALAGAILAAGGGWLTILGGSPYYLIAGSALTVSGVLVARHRRLGFWLYAVILAGTGLWAIWEVGFSLWALMPRLLGPSILGAVLLIPALRRGLK
jgi:hypothetical protein